MGKPCKLGETDCNTIGATILDIVHGTSYRFCLTLAIQNVLKDAMRLHNARSYLEHEYGYEKVEDRPKAGDFIVNPGRFRDDVAFVLSSKEAIACIQDNRGRFVRTVHPKDIQGEVYRWPR